MHAYRHACMHGRGLNTCFYGSQSKWLISLPRFYGCGSWQLLIGGVLSLVNSVNDRDLSLLNGKHDPSFFFISANYVTCTATVFDVRELFIVSAAVFNFFELFILCGCSF